MYGDATGLARRFMPWMALKPAPNPRYASAVHDDETRAWLALSLCAAGRPDDWLALARACGGALAAVHAADETLKAHGASDAAIAAMRSAWQTTSLRALERSRRLGLEVTALESPGYPASLARLSDPPLVLFWRGAAPSSLAPALAVVGARRCSGYGERTATRIGREVAEAGVTVVSGLARGIDAAAHRGALETGRTAAVLAGGLDRVYPGEHRSLAERIVEAGGSMISEQPPGVSPLPWLFPFRNRIITGLAAATVVVEAASRSGSLASARHALDQGRDVFAVPGPIDSALSEGTNRLLSQGAAPFRKTTDLGGVPGLASMVKKSTRKPLEQLRKLVARLPPEQAAILAAAGSGDVTPDQISEATALDGTRVLALLTALELDGLLLRVDHGRFRALARGA